MAGRLQGKSALVTAAGQGMGRAAVLAFAREGARVVATDLKDGTRSRSCRRVSRRTVWTYSTMRRCKPSSTQVGAVDILFNCAGWVHQGTILDCTVEDWDFSFDLNVRSMFVLSKAMLPQMIAAGGGVILNMASVLGAHKAAPNRLAYAAEQGRGGGLHARARDRPREAGDPRQLRLPRAPSTRRRSAIASTPSPTRCRRARTSSRASRWAGSPPPRRSPRLSSTWSPTSRRS